MPAIFTKRAKPAKTGVFVNNRGSAGRHAVGYRVIGQGPDVIIAPFLFDNDRRIACLEARKVGIEPRNPSFAVPKGMYGDERHVQPGVGFKNFPGFLVRLNFFVQQLQPTLHELRNFPKIGKFDDPGLIVGGEAG